MAKSIMLRSLFDLEASLVRWLFASRRKHAAIFGLSSCLFCFAVELIALSVGCDY